MPVWYLLKRRAGRAHIYCPISKAYPELLLLTVQKYKKNDDAKPYDLKPHCIAVHISVFKTKIIIVYFNDYKDIMC